MAIGDFSAQAEAYVRSRPDYPPALLALIADAMVVVPGGQVADIGAGTGILSRQLVHLGYRVTAIEPNRTMRELAANEPKITWRGGSFEATGLDDRSQDWVVAAQAFHWADPPQALPEIRRVLRRDATFTVMWNNRLNDDSPVVAWTRQAIARIVPDFDHAYRDTDWSAVLSAGGHFGEAEYHEERHVVSMSRERYLDLWRGHNRLTNIAGPERFQQLLHELSDHLDHNAVSQVDVPYLCRAWSVQPRFH